jgi:acetyltransferase-like isoleucine patch superfamily enzyme
VRWGIGWRIACTVAAIVVIETIVCGASALPIVWAWRTMAVHTARWPLPARLLAFSVAFAPSYVLFVLCLMGWSALAMRLTGARTPADATLRIADYSWPLMAWARSTAIIHVVRVTSGSLFRGSPIWTAFARLAGARVGRRVYINTTSISDYNLIELEDDVVIGADVHVSGHTVEDGLLKTGRVRIGRSATIGLGTVVDIDVEIGERCRVGALSLIPKHSRLGAGRTYAGVPVKPLT